MKFKKRYEKKYCKNILSYCKNNLIYSDEPYEFRIISGTPDGKIVIPNKMIHFPYDAKKLL